MAAGAATGLAIAGLATGVLSLGIELRRQDIQFGLQVDIAGLQGQSIQRRKVLAQTEFGIFQRSSEQKETFLTEITELKKETFGSQEKLLGLQNLSAKIGEASQRGDVRAQIEQETARSNLVLEQLKLSGAGRGRSAFLNTYSALALTATFRPSQRLAALEKSGTIREQAFGTQKELIQNALARLDVEFEFQLQGIINERAVQLARFATGQKIFNIEIAAAGAREAAAREQQEAGGVRGAIEGITGAFGGLF